MYDTKSRSNTSHTLPTTIIHPNIGYNSALCMYLSRKKDVFPHVPTTRVRTEIISTEEGTVVCNEYAVDMRANGNTRAPTQYARYALFESTIEMLEMVHFYSR